MQRIRPLGKGDPLCPLGFHPQVRWPTRCKRCFRDYKEHGYRNKETEQKLQRNSATASSPTLDSWSSRSDDKTSSSFSCRSWTSTNNLNTDSTSSSPVKNNYPDTCSKGTSSWTSTPDLGSLPGNTKADIETTYSLTLPRKKPVSELPEDNTDDYRRTQFTIRRRVTPVNSRVTTSNTSSNDQNDKNCDVNFLLQVKNGKAENKQTYLDKDDPENASDTASTTNTEDTDTTLVHESQLQIQVENLKQQLSDMKSRCERAEKEKNDMLLRRVAFLDNSISTKTTTTELFKLQKKCNDYKNTCDSLQEEKKSLLQKVSNLENRNTNELEKEIEQLKSKLQAAESLCEELMDENEEVKKELRDMEDEIEEMQDNFRENEADEYTTIKKELEQTSKNCRILSFKLKKSERKCEQLETDKIELERQLNENIQQLQKELDEANQKAAFQSSLLESKKKPAMLGSIPKLPSCEKVSRASLTRGGSQEDPVQLQRDLQDSMEREADLKEQLRNAEEEAQNLRKKVARVEDDNESLLMQLKKMATKARSRRSSPTHSHLSPESAIEKDEGISDEEDPAELKILLELNEQESMVLRKKIEELEQTCDSLKRKANDFQEKLVAQKVQKSSIGHRNTNSDDVIKKLESEVFELRNKLQTKEQECTELSSELACNKKKSKTLQKSRSLDYDQHTVDLQQQLKLIEQEVSVLRSQNCDLEAENEKLQNENKQLIITKGAKKVTKQSDEVAGLKTKLSKIQNELEAVRKGSSESNRKLEELNELKRKCSELESENARLTKNIKLIKEGNVEEFLTSLLKNWKPLKPTNEMEKPVLKRMVEQLQNEREEIILAFEKCSANYKNELDKFQNNSEQKLLISNLEETVKKMEKQMTEYKDKVSRLEKDRERIISEKRILETNKTKLEESKNKEKNIRDKEKNTFEEQKKKYLRELSELKSQNAALSLELKNNQKKCCETNDQLASAYQELEEQRKLVDSLRSKLESAQSAVKSNSKFSTELSEKNKKISDLEKKILDLEEKFKKSDKLVLNKKEKITNLEKELEMLKKNKLTKEQEKELSLKKEAELQDKIAELEKILSSQNSELKEKNEQIRKLELKLMGDKTVTNSTLTMLEKDLSNANKQVCDLKEKLTKMVEEKRLLEDGSQAITNELRSQINQWKANAEKLEISLEVERDALTQYKSEKEKVIQQQEAEIKTLRNKINNVANDKLIQNMKEEFNAKIDVLKAQLMKKQKECDELYSRYNQSETEHIRTKSHLTSQTDKLQSQLLSTSRELKAATSELNALKSTFVSKQDGWFKDKLNLERQLKEAEKSVSCLDTYKLEHSKLRAIHDVKVSELEQLKKEMEVQMDQIDHLRKENEEIQNKLDDYEKVSKVQRNMLAETSAIESELRDYKNRLYNDEKSRKVEVTALKLRYENHIAAISDELKDVQSQVMRFKHERDNYKHLLENVNQQRPASETRNFSEPDEVDSYQIDRLHTEVATLEQQISCMEDELSESRVECSRLKTELVSERSAWEVKVSEMMSRINELEEDRVLHSGRTKIAGLKTRMELSWQKEREEQNRLLQETSTLARDLRQTLFEVERERDKERLESKRRINQLKRNMEEGQEEAKKKLNSMQCDIMELRDSYAKLRTTNEKLRREKERLEKENFRQSVPRQSSEDDEQRKMAYIIDLVSELLKIAPQYYATNTSDSGSLTLPNKRMVDSSRESSLEHRTSSRENSVPRDDKEIRQSTLQSTLQKLSDVMHQLKKPNHIFHRNKSNSRKAFSSNRSASTESEKNALSNMASLNRKCISLEQTATPVTVSGDQTIWRTNDDTDGSISSFQSYEDSYNNGYRTEQSFDSRLSGGSTQSEIIPSSLEKKKKKGLFGRLKLLKKSSKSFDDADAFPSNSGNQSDPGSNSSISSYAIPNNDNVPKRDFKDTLSSMFKKPGSRSSSSERKSQNGNLSEVIVQSPVVHINSANLTKRPPTSASSTSSKSAVTTRLQNKVPGSAPVQRKFKK